MKCNFSNQYWKFINGVACNADELEILGPNEIVTTVNNEVGCYYHKTYPIKILSIKSSAVQHLPKGLENFFTELIGLCVSSTNLKRVGKSDLVAFPKLKQVYFNFNKIEMLESDLFKHNPELKHINFEYNRIKFIGENIFESLARLENLYLRNNVCINKDVFNQDELPELLAEINKNCQMSNELKVKFNNESVLDLQEELSEVRLENQELKRKLRSLEKTYNGTFDH